MSELVADCPRCGAGSITFNLVAATEVEVQYDWQQWYEAFCVCRHCDLATIFHLADASPNESTFIRRSGGLAGVAGAVNRFVVIAGYVSLKDKAGTPTPEHVPPEIAVVFSEGATCLAVCCFNAAGTMFRLCVDLATRSLLPETGDEPNAKVRRDLGLRLPWLLEHDLLPKALKELSSCIREDGNDGAHQGTLKKEDAEDLLDFTTSLLERLYTQPERLRLAGERREKRRGS